MVSAQGFSFAVQLQSVVSLINSLEIFGQMEGDLDPSLALDHSKFYFGRVFLFTL